MANPQKHPVLVVQSPFGSVCFLALALAWFVGRLVPEQAWERLVILSRLSGYAAALAMLVPFLHILRRFRRYRNLGQSHRWMSCHIATAYLGFLFLLLHCRVRAATDLTFALVLLTWGVMLSGVAGFYGQKILYHLLPRLIHHEYGLERLEPERRDCLESAYRLLAENQFTNWETIPTAKGTDPWSDALGKAIVQLCESCHPTQQAADLLGMELLEAVGSQKLNVDSSDKPPSELQGLEKPIKGISWFELLRLARSERQLKDFVAAKKQATGISLAELWQLVASKEPLQALAVSGGTDKHIDWNDLLRVQKQRELVDCEAARKLLIRMSKSESKRSNHLKMRIHSHVVLGCTLHQLLGRKGLVWPTPGVGAAAVGRRPLRWANREQLRAYYRDLIRFVPQASAEFVDRAIDKCLARPFTLWRWARTGKESYQLYEIHYKRALETAPSLADQQLLEDLWRLVEKRRLLDLEYRLHSLGRIWQLGHGPLALALLALMAEHIFMSLRFGGF